MLLLHEQQISLILLIFRLNIRSDSLGPNILNHLLLQRQGLPCRSKALRFFFENKASGGRELLLVLLIIIALIILTINTGFVIDHYFDRLVLALNLKIGRPEHFRSPVDHDHFVADATCIHFLPILLTSRLLLQLDFIERCSTVCTGDCDPGYTPSATIDDIALDLLLLLGDGGAPVVRGVHQLRHARLIEYFSLLLLEVQLSVLPSVVDPVQLLVRGAASVDEHGKLLLLLALLCKLGHVV